MFIYTFCYLLQRRFVARVMNLRFGGRVLDKICFQNLKIFAYNAQYYKVVLCVIMNKKGFFELGTVW